MKIVISANTSWYVFNFQKNLIRSLIEQGHRVFVISPPDDYVDKLLRLGVEYYPLRISQRGMNPFREIGICMKLLRLLKNIKPDLALTFTVKCNLYTGLCRRLMRFHHVPNISGLGEVFEKKGPLNFIVSSLYKFALAGSKRIFFQNHEDMRFIVDRRLLPENICSRIPGSGVDLKTFRPAPSGQSDKPLTFFTFGRLVPNKGYDLFIKAAESICHDENYNARFWIMGIADNSRKESQELLERILAMHDKGIIRYIPACDDVVSVLDKVDVVVQPSKYNEGVPRSLLEALACAKPIITTDWKGCKCTVDHDQNGYLIDVDDLDSLVRYIKKMIDAPSCRLIEMGSISRKKAEEQFDEAHVLSAYDREVTESSLSLQTC